MARRLLYLLLFLQALTHLFWLSPAAHSGQVAIPWMMNQGLSLFTDIWEQHAPGASLLAAAALRLLPFEPGLAIKLLNTLLALALTLLIYAVAARASGRASAGLFAAAFWAWWLPVYGNVLFYFDTLLALPILAALYVYFDNRSQRQIILIGLFMGAATLFKQHAWLALLVMALCLLARDRRRESVLLYAGAALALPALQWLLLAADGALEPYLFWNWTFNLSGYMDGVGLDGDFFRKALLTNLLVFPFAICAWQEAGRRQMPLLLMWLSALILLYPRVGEIHVMAHLPFSAVMSGIVLARLLPMLRGGRPWDLTRQLLAGLSLGIGLGWLWTGAAAYLHLPLGPGGILGYDEFRDLAAQLRADAAEDDSLFVLPETDSTPQLHPLTGMLPPGLWVKGWRWYFRPEHVLPSLLSEWQETPPTWIVVFRDLIRPDNPGIKPLLNLLDGGYQAWAQSDVIYGHGRAEIYKRLDSGE